MGKAGLYPLASGDENRIKRTLCASARRTTLEVILKGVVARPDMMDRSTLTDTILHRWDGRIYKLLLMNLGKYLYKYDMHMVILEGKGHDDPT